MFTRAEPGDEPLGTATPPRTLGPAMGRSNIGAHLSVRNPRSLSRLPSRKGVSSGLLNQAGRPCRLLLLPKLPVAGDVAHEGVRATCDRRRMIRLTATCKAPVT